MAALPHVRLPRSVDCNQPKGTLQKTLHMSVAHTDLPRHAALSDLATRLYWC